MGLDAHVSCDCFERGKLRSPPPPGCHLSVYKDGSLLCGSDELEVELAFDRWRHSEACEHEDGYLVAHRLGNMALIGALRAELGQWPKRFPVILSRVIYNGIHGGDFIPADEVPSLIPEVKALSAVHCTKPDMEQFMRDFELQMIELVTAALQVKKPLTF
jgi:hypothetical protein